MMPQEVSRAYLDAEVKTAVEVAKNAASPAVQNSERLNSCRKPHKFQVPVRTITGFLAGWLCESCGGYVTDAERRWYAQGLTHGRQEHDASYPDLPVGGALSPTSTTRA
jgi:hypothetical protein